MLSLLRLECKQNNYSSLYGICIFLFLSYSFGIETINAFIHSIVPSKTTTNSRPKWAKCIPIDHIGAKPLPDGVAFTYMAYIREYPPPPCGGFIVMFFSPLKITPVLVIYVAVIDNREL